MVFHYLPVAVFAPAGFSRDRPADRRGRYRPKSSLPCLARVAAAVRNGFRWFVFTPLSRSSVWVVPASFERARLMGDEDGPEGR